MLTSLQLRDVGPAPEFEVELSDRLNLFTGDNGLGKSFILDIAWWALTGDWAALAAWPRRDEGAVPQIEFRLSNGTHSPKEPCRSQFDFRRQEWRLKKLAPSHAGLVVYARVDGGFSLWDPARNYRKLPTGGRREASLRPAAYQFTPETLWNGLEERGKMLCNGLIRDWVSWQNQPRSSPFESLRSVLKCIAPAPEEPIDIGTPVRIHPDEARDIPTVRLDYGDVPVVFASAAVKRIVSLAYLLTWAWDEHKQAARLRNQKPAKHMVLLLDEAESHLHPRWQRTILPSLLRVGDVLQAEIDMQVLATTHAPLILASIEPRFDEDRDSLFLFELDGQSKEVTLRRLPWAMQGDASGWLTSPVFGLREENATQPVFSYQSGRKLRKKGIVK